MSGCQPAEVFSTKDDQLTNPQDSVRIKVKILLDDENERLNFDRIAAFGHYKVKFADRLTT